jgi:hypothetical protein
MGQLHLVAMLAEPRCHDYCIDTVHCFRSMLMRYLHTRDVNAGAFQQGWRNAVILRIATSSQL